MILIYVLNVKNGVNYMNGKGDKQRVPWSKQYADNYNRIFGENMKKDDIEWHSIKTIAASCEHWVRLEPGTQLNVMKKHRDEIIKKGWGKDDIL